jgi:uncharacterized membrane protein
MQNRFKSPLVWTSIISALILIGQATGIIAVDKADMFTQIGQTILALLVTMGILNNPTNGDGF